MTTRAFRASDIRRLAQAVDRRGWAEVAVLFILVAVVAALMTDRLAAAAANQPTPSQQTLIASLGIATIAAIAAVAGTIWSWKRNGGRAAQRLGRRSWRTGKLPESFTERLIAFRDLERRRRLLRRRAPQIVLTVVWVVLTAMQLWIDHSIPSVIVWTLLLGSILYSGIRDTLDRRQLPRLDALLRDDQTQMLQQPARK